MFFYHTGKANILTISKILHNSLTMLCSITKLHASFKMRPQHKTSLPGNILEAWPHRAYFFTLSCLLLECSACIRFAMKMSTIEFITLFWIKRLINTWQYVLFMQKNASSSALHWYVKTTLYVKQRQIPLSFIDWPLTRLNSQGNLCFKVNSDNWNTSLYREFC